MSIEGTAHAWQDVYLVCIRLIDSTQSTFSIYICVNVEYEAVHNHELKSVMIHVTQIGSNQTFSSKNRPCLGLYKLYSLYFIVTWLRHSQDNLKNITSRPIGVGSLVCWQTNSTYGIQKFYIKFNLVFDITMLEKLKKYLIT